MCLRIMAPQIYRFNKCVISLVVFGSVLESNAIYWGIMMMSDNIADIDDSNSIRDA